MSCTFASWLVADRPRKTKDDLNLLDRKSEDGESSISQGTYAARAKERSLIFQTKMKPIKQFLWTIDLVLALALITA